MERIQAKNPELHTALRSGYTTTIILSPMISLEEGETGNKMGTAQANINDVSNRLFIDPETVVTATTGPNRYRGCPINAVLYMRISNEELEGLYAALQDEPRMVPPVVDRIAEIYPEEASQLREWLAVNNVSMVDELEIFITNKKLSYRPTEPEIAAVLTVEPGIINLNEGALADLSLYALAPFASGTISMTSSYNWEEYERTNLTGAREVRQKEYTRVLAHEMQHINHKLTNMQTSYIWQIMDDIIPYSNCYPGRSGTNTDYCSQGGGHEYQNPDGISACAEGDEYPEPRANN